MVKAVENLHKVGFIHWDIKSENFVVSDDMKSITLIDFGLCHSTEQILNSQFEDSNIIVSIFPIGITAIKGIIFSFFILILLQRLNF